MCTVGWNVRCHSHYGKEVFCFLNELKIKLPYHTAIPLCGMYPETVKAMFQKYIVHPCLEHIAPNSQKIEATEMSITGWMGKQSMVYTYNGIIFSLGKEENSGTCYNMDEPWGDHTKWNKSITKKCCMILHIWDTMTNQNRK